MNIKERNRPPNCVGMCDISTFNKMALVDHNFNTLSGGFILCYINHTGIPTVEYLGRGFSECNA